MTFGTEPGTPVRRAGDIVTAIKGAGEMASAVACRLHHAGFRRLFLMELPRPLAVRRRVAFSDAIYEGQHQVEGVTAQCVPHPDAIEEAWRAGRVAVVVDPQWQALRARAPLVLIDAILAKRNLGTRRGQASIVIALGPGFTAGVDADAVIGTNRGHHLGRIYTSGTDEPDTGIPAPVLGHTLERVLRAPCDGAFTTALEIGDLVRRGDRIGSVDGIPLHAAIDGVLRGLLRPGMPVRAGFKIGDIDPRGDARLCDTVSDKARAIAGSVLEVILQHLHDGEGARAGGA
jgi:xanthine dehydrogenase accessory factor